MAITLPTETPADFVRAADPELTGSMVVTFTADKAFIARFDRLTRLRGIARAQHIKLLMARALAEAERDGEL